MQWVTRVTSQAGVANGIALALGFYWPVFTTGVGRAITIASITLALGWINLRGIRLSAFAIDFFTIAKLAAARALHRRRRCGSSTSVALSPSGAVSLPQISTAALLLIFAFGGYDVIGVPAGEARDPRRHLPFAFVATILTVTAVMTLAQVVALGTLPDLQPVEDAAGRRVVAVHRRRRGADHQRGIGRVDDGQQPRRRADRFAHALRARRERRAAAFLCEDSSALSHAVECRHLHDACGAGPGAVGIVRHTRRRERGRAADHLHRRLRGDAAAAITTISTDCQPCDVRDSIRSGGAAAGDCRFACLFLPAPRARNCSAAQRGLRQARCCSSRMTYSTAEKLRRSEFLSKNFAPLRRSGETPSVINQLVLADSDALSLLPIGLPTSPGPSDRRWPGA